MGKGKGKKSFTSSRPDALSPPQHGANIPEFDMANAGEGCDGVDDVSQRQRVPFMPNRRVEHLLGRATFGDNTESAANVHAHVRKRLVKSAGTVRGNGPIVPPRPPSARHPSSNKPHSPLFRRSVHRFSLALNGKASKRRSVWFLFFCEFPQFLILR